MRFSLSARIFTLPSTRTTTTTRHTHPTSLIKLSPLALSQNYTTKPPRTTTSTTTVHPLRILKSPLVLSAAAAGALAFSAYTHPSMPNFFSSLFHTSPTHNMTYPLQKSDNEWRAQLSPEQFRVIREKGTEAPFTGKYDKHVPDPKGTGVYSCAACNAPLYKANHKFKSGCGWPAFFDAIPGAVVRHEDRTFGMARTEIVCGNCGGHLGHVFKGEGYDTPTDERHCVNSVSIDFGEDKADAKDSKA